MNQVNEPFDVVGEWRGGNNNKPQSKEAWQLAGKLVYQPTDSMNVQ